MNKDRGTMKWTALMLPEHIERLREWEQELKRETKKELTEWELEALHQTIEVAYQTNQIITFTIFKHHHTSMLTGTIQAIHLQQRVLTLASDAYVTTVYLDTIQAAELHD